MNKKTVQTYCQSHLQLNEYINFFLPNTIDIRQFPCSNSLVPYQPRSSCFLQESPLIPAHGLPPVIPSTPLWSNQGCPWPSFAVVFHSRHATELAERLNQLLILPEKGGNRKETTKRQCWRQTPPLPWRLFQTWDSDCPDHMHVQNFLGSYWYLNQTILKTRHSGSTQTRREADT